jgi:hypothetical protein
MAIQVDGIRVRHNGKVYHPGETIEKIKDDEAKRLVETGHAFFIDKKSSKRKAEEILPSSV